MKEKQRDSGIEVLKIIAIVLIVISHVTQTYAQVINYKSLYSFQFTALAYFRHFGTLGNLLFFISSAWFLLRSEKAALSKWMVLLTEGWIISVTILLVSYPLLQDRMELKTILRCLFPTTFSNNWYLTCYLLFYPLHPFLNRLIRQMSQRALFEFSAVSFLLYFVMGSLFQGLFFSSELILWVIVYFIVAYIRNYAPDTKGLHRSLIFIGLAGFLARPLILGILGQYIDVLQGMMTYFVYNDDPFLLMLALGLFLSFKDIHFHHRAVNAVAKLALPVYLIHENLLMRRFFRLDMARSLYARFGRSCVLPQVLGAAACILTLSLLCAWLYSATLRRCAIAISRKACPLVEKSRMLIEERLHIPH